MQALSKRLLSRGVRRDFSFNRKMLVKPFTLVDRHMILSAYLIPAKFEQRNEMIVAEQTGCMVLEFIPVNTPLQAEDRDYFDDIYKKEVVLDWNKKRTFTLQYRNLGQLIHFQHDDPAGLRLQKAGQSISIEQVCKEKVRISLDEEGYSLAVHYGDFVVLQQLVALSLEHLLGWSGLGAHYLDKINRAAGF